MIALASGHQVRCIPWVQMGIFNKEIGFLGGLKPTIKSTFDVANIVKTATVRDVPINNDALLTYRPVKLMFGKMVSGPLFGSSPNIR